MHRSRTRDGVAQAANTPLLFLGALSLFVASCGGSSFVAPASPTPVAPSGTTAFGLSGTISEVILTGLAPLAGAQVSTGGVSATTNAQGFYTLSGLDGGPLDVTISKAGYKAETRTVRFPSNAIQGFFDAEIVRDSDIHAVSGVVSEVTATGLLTPVAGVEVAVMSCNAVSRGCLYNVFQSMKTDTTGGYRFQGLYAGKNNFFWVTKEGYDVVGMPPMLTCDNCNGTLTLDGDARFDVQLVRR